jgi:hypothetical protein
MSKASVWMMLMGFWLLACDSQEPSANDQMFPNTGQTAGTSPGASGTSGGVTMPGTGAGTGSATAGTMASAGTSAGQQAMAGSPPPAGTGAAAGGMGGSAGEPPAQACPANMQANAADADPCTAPLRPGEDRLCEFSYEGQTRKFYMYAPPSYNACQPAAMVMDCHGASESAGSFSLLR